MLNAPQKGEDMRVDSLEKLGVLFDGWRREKEHVRERVPERLLARARRAAAVHGVGAVVQATAIDYRRLGQEMVSKRQRGSQRASRVGETGGGGGNAKDLSGLSKGSAVSVPSYSRMELRGPKPPSRAVAEVETPAGVKVRIFELTVETVSLLSALCTAGGAA